MLINEEIRASEVRLIGDDGEPFGIISTKEALRMATEKNLDLVLIAPTAKPPVCKIINYGKYKFEVAKREKEAKKNQKVISIKEVRLSATIDSHDFDTKLNHAKKFLTDGDKVKVSIRFRGREITHSALGGVVMKKFAEALEELGTVERMPRLEGRSMIMFISPKK